MQLDDRVQIGIRHEAGFFELDDDGTSSSLRRHARARMIDEEVAHDLAGEGEKMRAIIQAHAGRSDQTHVGLVNDGGRCQRNVDISPTAPLVRELLQPIVHQRDKSLARFRITVAPFPKQAGDVGRRLVLAFIREPFDHAISFPSGELVFTALTLEVPMRPASPITHHPRWGIAALLSLTVAAGGACHHSARNAGAPLPLDTLDNGYTTSVREHASGGVRSLGPEEIARLRVRRVEELLAGRVPGLRVLPTADGGFTVRIRGITTLSGNTEPLYIIDGMPVTLLPGEGLSWLDPAEILYIDVLKDPAETSLYGVRGANGVIVIRTKGGSR